MSCLGTFRLCIDEIQNPLTIFYPVNQIPPTYSYLSLSIIQGNLSVTNVCQFEGKLLDTVQIVPHRWSGSLNYTLLDTTKYSGPVSFILTDESKNQCINGPNFGSKFENSVDLPLTTTTTVYSTPAAIPTATPTATPASSGYTEWNALLIAVVVLASLLLLSVIIVGYLIQRKKKQEQVLTPYAVSLIKGEVDHQMLETSRISAARRTLELREDPLIVQVTRSNSISTQYYSLSDTSSDVPTKESLDSQSFKTAPLSLSRSLTSSQSFKSGQSSFRSAADQDYESEEEIEIPTDIVRPPNIVQNIIAEDSKSISSDGVHSDSSEDTIKLNK
ncbi:hypothetical protein HDV01_006984 [Terramyces sp. JEL0728]|nr:hypothetical protein HDV01_006984 [Terramyces sp. JEL0728]